MRAELKSKKFLNEEKQRLETAQKKIKVEQLEPSKMIPLSKAVPGISVKYGIQTLTSEIMLGKQILRLEIKVR